MQFYRYYIIPSIHKIDFWSETILMDTKTLNVQYRCPCNFV